MLLKKRFLIFLLMIFFFVVFLFSANNANVNLNRPVVFPYLNKSVMGNTTFFQKASNDKNLILLKNAIFDPIRDGEVDLSNLVPNRLKFAPVGKKHYIIQFKNNITLYDRMSLKRLGVKILEYIPNNGFLVEMDSNLIDKVKGLDEVRWVGDFQPGYKLSPELANYIVSKINPFETKVPELAVILFNGKSVADVINSLSNSFISDPSFGFKITDDHAFLVKISYKNLKNLIDFLSNSESVSYLEVYHKVYLKNNNSIWVCQSGDMDTKATPVFDHGIMGQGEIVAVADSGVRTDSCFFINAQGDDPIANSYTQVDPPGNITVNTSYRKIIGYNVLSGAEFGDNDPYHGTHVCGSVGGDNIATPATTSDPGHDSGDGMAPLAKIVFEDAGSPEGGEALNLPYPYLNLWQQEYNAGARLSSNSWGGSTQSGTGAYYEQGCVTTDLFTYRNEDFLVFFAAGNSGPNGRTLDYEGNAKDAVIVGATKNGSTGAKDMAYFSSKGPAADGRIKPDVSAPGYQIVSAYGASQCATQVMSGTSMATPTAAGLAALVRCYFDEGFYPTGSENSNDSFDPSAALVKAVLINSCQNMTGINTGGKMNTKEDAPSNGQGWGRITLDNALYFNGDSRKLLCWDYRNAQGITTGEERDFAFSTNSGSNEPLKITLVWSDPPGAAMAAKELVNDLDLELVAPDGTIYRGNQWNDQTSGDLKESAQNPTGTDTLNNVEGILIKAPQSGTYTLKVKGTNVPGFGEDFKQGFALVVTGDVSMANALQLNIADLNIDDSNGNNNGILDPGETVNLVISLSNNSSVDASNVNATLSSSSDKVNISTSNAYYGDISAGDTVAPYGSFTLTVDPSVEGGKDLNFTLTITAGGQTFTKNFTLKVAIPDTPPILEELDLAEDEIFTTSSGSYPTYVTTDLGYKYYDPNLDAKKLYVFFQVNGHDTGTIPYEIDLSTESPQVSEEMKEAWEIYAFMYFASNVGDTVSAYGYIVDSKGNVSDLVQSNSFTYTLGTTPTDLAGLDDDDSIYIPFPNGFTFPFYGKTYSGMYVNSDGNITFNAGYEWQERDPEALLWYEPRIAPLYTDVAKEKGNANEITMETGDDYVKVSWNGVKQWGENGSLGSNTFSVTLKKDGTITFDYGSCSMILYQEGVDGVYYKGVVGLSPGGVDYKVDEVDLSTYTNPITIPVNAPIYEAFTKSDSFDLSNTQLVFKPTSTFTTAQTIYFPVLDYQSGSKNVGYGFVNTNSNPALIKFTAYDTNGNEIAQSDIMQLNPGSQIAYELPSIFPNIADGSVGWIKAESSVSGLKGFFLLEDFSSGSLTGLDGSNGFTQGYSDLIVPEIKNTGNFSTTLYVVNLSGSSQDVTLKGYDENGSVGTTTVTIPANGSYINTIDQIFGQGFDGYVEISGSGNLIANALVRDGSASISSVNGVNVSSGNTKLYAPHTVYWQDQYYTTLFLVNTSSSNASVNVIFHNEDGTTSGSPLSYTIPANGIKILTNADIGLDTSVEKSLGWVEVDSDQPLIGALEFGCPTDDHYRATLPLQTAGMTDLYFSQVANGIVGSVKFWTGLALVNPNDSKVTVNIEVYGSDGKLYGKTGNITVNSNAKLIALLSQFQNLTHLLGQSSGYIHVTSDSPVFAFELFGNDALDFISSVSAQ